MQAEIRESAERDFPGVAHFHELKDEGQLVSMYSTLNLTSALKIERLESGFKAETKSRMIWAVRTSCPASSAS